MTGIYKWGWGGGGKAVAFWGWVELWASKGVFVPTFVKSASVSQVAGGFATATAVKRNFVPLSVAASDVARIANVDTPMVFSTRGTITANPVHKISYGAGGNSLTINSYRIAKSVAGRGQTGIAVKRGTKKVVKR